MRLSKYIQRKNLYNHKKTRPFFYSWLSLLAPYYTSPSHNIPVFTILVMDGSIYGSTVSSSVTRMESVTTRWAQALLSAVHPASASAGVNPTYRIRRRRLDEVLLRYTLDVEATHVTFSRYTSSHSLNISIKYLHML